MKLLAAKLVNFQAHRDTEITFGPGITTIVGPTDAGKSAIIRALEWVLRNSIRGDAVLRHGSKFVEVEVQTDTFAVCRMRKGSGEGQYEVTLPDGTVSTFKAVAAGLPDQVAGLNVGELNVARQHDTPFWFSKTAGEVSRQLNAAINLEVMDRASTAAASRVRQAVEQVRIVAAQRDQALAEVKACEAKQQRIKDFRALEALKFRYEEMGPKVKALKHFFQCRANAQTWEECIEDGLAIEAAAKHLQQIGEQRDSVQKQVDIVRTQSRIINLPEVPPLTPIYEAVQFSRREVDCLTKALATYRSASAELEQRNAQVQETHTTLTKFTGQPCPLCQQPLPSPLQ